MMMMQSIILHRLINHSMYNAKAFITPLCTTMDTPQGFSTKSKSKMKKKSKKGLKNNKKTHVNNHHRHQQPQKLAKNRPRKSPQQIPLEPNENLEKKAPPLFLYQTASPHVYISSIAIENSISSSPHDHNDDDNDHTYDDEDLVGSQNGDDIETENCTSSIPSEAIHPKSLFTETIIPRLFYNSTFEYISPKDFNHELPVDSSIPEVAVLGKSNVGKSSLLNAVTGVKDLARISKTPGRTQQVNYFGQFAKSGQVTKSHVGSNAVGWGHDGGDNDLRDIKSTPPTGYIIDLPGYGYANAPDNLVSKWQQNTQDFLIARKEFGTLQRLYMLVDARHGLTVFDSTIMGWMDEACIDYTVVLTKCDSTTKPMLIKRANEICMRYHSQLFQSHTHGEIVGYQSPFVHVTSSRKGIGIVEMMHAIDADFFVGGQG